MLPLNSCGYVTGGLRGIAGQLLQRHEDFMIEELPAYEPAGQGDYFYLFIESTGATSRAVAGAVAKAFNVEVNQVGLAEEKTLGAAVRQHFSIYLPDLSKDAQRSGLDRLNSHQNIETLWTDWGEKGLEPGMLAGNRFVVSIREVSPTSVLQAKKIIDRLSATGAANYYIQVGDDNSEQNASIGQSLILEKWQEALEKILDAGQQNPLSQTSWQQRARELDQQSNYKQAIVDLDKSQLAFYISAWQGAMFNQVLDNRVKSGSFNKLVAGDLAYNYQTKVLSVINDAKAKEQQASDFQVSATGPVWGLDMLKAYGAVGQLEQQILAGNLVTVEHLASTMDDLAALGKRRPLVAPLLNAQVSGGADDVGTFVKLSFELPAGAFAYSVLREVMKP